MDTTPAPSRATTLPYQTPKRARSSPTPCPADIGCVVGRSAMGWDIAGWVGWCSAIDYTKEFQDFINSFSKSNRKGVMRTARICEFNKKFNTNFQIYVPKHRHFQPKKVSEELDWVFYLHKSHFCLIRRNNKTLGIKEIEDNYDENVWKTCKDHNAVTQVSPLKLNFFPTIHDDCLYAWDCETYSEKETNKAIPYFCTLINLEKRREMLYRIKHNFPDLNPTDSVSEEFYNKLMNILEIFVGKDCIDQMLQRLGKIDQTLISHNGSGFDNWIVLKNAKKLTQCPLVTARGIHGEIHLIYR
ncbi:hypothetical protein LOTGIDRAFT_163784 [Lottia gigantea]|uniref:DNA-directed DNA polymerase n=1 Tax=Lottia gigantea TaxID=225164 RepID=V4AC85_LOTGI|nr:hypothetical protein LOTGIDRAFT_163784 [Lottia gigantea]ESO90896.1 hypothetical protein LOTGIDRAFT_163784 [Lottia gigantea]